MDAQYIFECTWKMEESAVTDGRLYSAVINTTLSDISQIKPFKNWDDAAEAIDKYIRLKLSNTGSHLSGYIEIEFDNTEIYPDEIIDDFFEKVAPFCKGHLCFDNGLISLHRRCTFVNGKTIYTDIYPQENIYVVFSKTTEQFVGTVSESFVETVDKTKYKIESLKLEFNSED
ncbi:hypothetical protein [Ruminococcus albus]|uniref:Uncharacterized protein n=2 Tax=Ruminococcus albus TaxID=1264 RepID=E6UJS5_RUMA7|nr:hypothetical protein [Ruminococcus albus]ADU23921.1 hypothetical protein Rumal_3474 [Ruminococcus albus 7 = DSM 20455]